MTIQSLTSSRVVRGAVRRGRSAFAQMYLRTRRTLAGRPIWIDHNGVRLPFHGDGDLQELYYYLYGNEWWENECSLLARYVQQGNVAVDIGANLGFMSGILSKLTGPAGRVFSFEPAPSTYAKLQKVIEINGFTNVTALNMGCGKEEGVLTLYCPPSSGHATLRPSREKRDTSRQQQMVRIVKLDEYLMPILSSLHFMKIDTEGYEDEVLLGALELLKKFRPVIYIELCSEYLVSSQRAIAILRDLGYSFDREPDLTSSSNGENFFACPAPPKD